MYAVSNQYAHMKDMSYIYIYICEIKMRMNEIVRHAMDDVEEMMTISTVMR